MDGRVTSGSRCGSSEFAVDAGFAGLSRRTLSGIIGVVARPVDAEGADGCRAGVRAFAPRLARRDDAEVSGADACSADEPEDDDSVALVSGVSA
jgi:hypothetical protein